MKKILLTGLRGIGKVALVDDEDFERVNQFKWSLTQKKGSSNRYAKHVETHNRPRGKGKAIMLHRFIINAPKGLQVDHINGDGLDCRKQNLRLATPRQNAQNMKKQRNKDGFKGVQENAYVNQKGTRRYRARISVGRKNIHLGYYSTPEAAALAYDNKAKEIFGEFANLNFNY